MKRSLIRKAIATAALVTAMVTGGAPATPENAEASTLYCSEGRCAVYLTQSDSRFLLNGRRESDLPPQKKKVR